MNSYTDMSRHFILKSLQSTGLFSDDFLTVFDTNVLHPDAYTRRLMNYSVVGWKAVASQTGPLLAPLVLSAREAIDTLPPHITGIAAIITIVLVVLITIRTMYRIVAWWTRLLMRLAFWAIMIALASMAYQRGLSVCIQDSIYFLGKVTGYAAFVKDVWLSEYQRWEEQAKASHASMQTASM